MKLKKDNFRWISLPEATRISIKQHVMGTLGTEPYHPSIAAQCVKAIACAELPTGVRLQKFEAFHLGKINLIRNL